jgi:hypothetical protein
MTYCIGSPSWSIFEGQTSPTLGLIWPVDDGYLDATTLPTWTVEATAAGSDTVLWTISTVTTQVGTDTVPSVIITWAVADLGSLEPGEYVLTVTGTDGADVVVIQQVFLTVRGTPGSATVCSERSSCCWPIIDCCDNPTTDDTIEEWSSIMAVDILYALSGRQYGTCQATIRPTREPCQGLPDANAWALIGTNLYSSTAGWAWQRGYHNQPFFAGASAVRLWHRDVCTIDEVQIDGDVVDPSLYRKIRRQGRWWLIRTDGESWPDEQDWTVDNYEEGSWSITYTHGRQVPKGGQVAAGKLKCELAKACAEDETCALPERVQTITRQGVTVGFLDAQDFLDKGRTGITMIDLWLTSVNPKAIRRRARLMAVPV